MRDRRDGDDLHTTHARVVEALEAAVVSHPAGSRRSARTGGDAAPADVASPLTRRRVPRPLPAGDGERAPSRLRRATADAVVVPLRAKVVELHPQGAGDEPDGPSAA